MVRVLSVWTALTYYRQDAMKRQTVGIKVTQVKNRICAMQGRLYSRDIWYDQGAIGSAWPQDPGVGLRPQTIKNFHF